MPASAPPPEASARRARAVAWMNRGHAFLLRGGTPGLTAALAAYEKAIALLHPLPFAENTPGASFVFALQALPVVLVVSALSSLLFYWRILPLFVKAFSWTLQKTMRIGGAVGLSAAANVLPSQNPPAPTTRVSLPDTASTTAGRRIIECTGSHEVWKPPSWPMFPSAPVVSR